MKYYHIIELILDFLSSLAWPIVAITVLMILKEPLKKLIGNIKKSDTEELELKLIMLKIKKAKKHYLKD